MNILCTICSDLINQAENIFVTKCGHMFHHHCLAQWIERSKSCPQCRNKVTDKCMFRLYPTISNEANTEDAVTLQSRLDDTQLQLRQQKAISKGKDDKLEALMADLKNTSELIRTYEKKLVVRESALTALKEQLEYLKIQNKDINKLKEQNDELQKNLLVLNGLQKVLNGSNEEVEKILENYTDLKTMALFTTSLKRALCDSEAKKNEYRDKLHNCQHAVNTEKTTTARVRLAYAEQQQRLIIMTRMYEALTNKRTASEAFDTTLNETTSPKQARSEEFFDLNTAMLDVRDNSLITMINRIEHTDSPYLSLKQSSLALSALQRELSYPETGIKPSEFAIINAARSHALKSSENVPLSIFHKKQPIKPDSCEAKRLDVSYDGLGGHSKLDTFPVSKPVLRSQKSSVPKLTAKHKLKRPSAPSNNQDLGSILKKIHQGKG